MHNAYAYIKQTMQVDLSQLLKYIDTATFRFLFFMAACKHSYFLHIVCIFQIHHFIFWIFFAMIARLSYALFMI